MVEKIHKVIITGRTGTTFLVSLLTRLGLDTGFDDPDEAIDKLSRAGLEFDLDDPSSPYIVKSPWLCETLDPPMRSKRRVIDHAIVPGRSLRDAAASRVAVSKKAGATENSEWDLYTAPPGGLLLTQDPAQQEEVLAREFYRLMRTLTVHQIPLTLLAFPRLVRDATYLYRKLRPILGKIVQRSFRQAFDATSQPELVHSYPKT